MIKIIYISIFLTCTSCTCSNIDNKQAENEQIENRNTNSFYQITMDDIINSENISEIDTIIKNIDFIYLENKEGPTLSEVNINLSKVGEKYIISSFRSNGVFQFDNSGHYEKTIITRGKAKNELSSDLYRWTYNKDHNVLTISLGYKIVYYDFNRNKNGGISFDQYYYNTIMLNSNNYVALPNINGNSISESIYLSFLDNNGKKIESKEYTKNRDLAYEMPKYYDGPLETYGLYSNSYGTVLYRDMFNDTIYNVSSNNKIEPYIVLNRHKYAPSVKDNNLDKKREKIFIKDVNETEKYFFIKYQYDEKMWSVILDKGTSKIISKVEIELTDRTTPFLNYSHFLKCKISENNSIIVGVVSYDKDKIYCIARPVDLENIDDYQNPIIMEVSLK